MADNNQKPNSPAGLLRTRSEQLPEVMATLKSPSPSHPASGGEGGSAAVGGGGSSVNGSVSSGGGTLSRKSSRRLAAASPGRSNAGSRNTHIRKWSSAQIKLDLDEVSSGAALSRASSASFGFSFTGFQMPLEDMADTKPFSDDDDIPEDLEAGIRKKRFQTEPTLPIYLKE